MKSKYYLVFFALLLQGCTSWKRIFSFKTGGANEAVHNAIVDFVSKPRYIKKDTVFSIYVKDLENNVFGVSIMPNRNKITLISDDGVKYDYRGFPTRYVEMKRRLFYWSDSTVKVSDELISKFYKMNWVDSAVVNKLFPLHSGSERQKSEHYYFCKSDLRKYKKVRTHIGMGRYNMPKPDCK